MIVQSVLKNSKLDNIGLFASGDNIWKKIIEAILEFNNVNIKVNDESMMSLTDLWKASGSTDNYKPVIWLRHQDTVEFINAASLKFNVPTEHILVSAKGRTGGTFAHWQIALAYAKYLSPELHMHVNEVYKERLEETANPELSIVRGRERAVATWKKQGRDDTWIVFVSGSMKLSNAVSEKLNLSNTQVLVTMNLNTEKSRIILAIQRGLTIAKKLKGEKSTLAAEIFATRYYDLM